MKTIISGRLHTLPLLVLLCLAACNQDPFLIVTRPDAGAHDATRSDATATDATSDATSEGGAGDGGPCVKTNGGVEICDKKDNDCNGAVDDVMPALLETDAKHCGKCDNACAYANAFAKCVKGSCTLDTCAPGYFDANKNWTDGCEYQCLQTNGGAEECPASQPNCACDNADNDCDNLVDEVFNKQSDANNCGTCGTRCLYNHAAGLCVAGKCKMGACEQGYADLNKSDTDGCEYGCPVWPVTAEKCNGKDDDCDTLVDEGSPGTGELCSTGKLGECKTGKTQCQSGKLACVQGSASTQESCDGKDNDCDGSTDEDFNLQGNPLHCGKCNKVCSYTHGIAVCDKGVCKLDKCAVGYKNLNGALVDGCEHKCQVWPATVESCNSKDDDCDKQIDEDFDTKTSIDHCGKCNNKCAYSNAAAQCLTGKCAMGNCDTNYYNVNTFTSDGCEYYCAKTNSGVEICDNVDNDCDGTIDDGFKLATDVNNCGTCGNKCSFSNAAASCGAGKCTMGTCTLGYKDIDGLAATGCEYKCPVWPALTTDLCDGVDNDCDTKIDEDFVATSCGSSAGECTAGTNACFGGSVFCQGGTGPTAEICDNKDNDCDNSTDEDFNKQSDPRYCGANCTKCNLPHAIASCKLGVCAIAICALGYVDLDKNPANGCEVACTVTGTEICDGLDNDCNGKTDSADTGMIPLGMNPCYQFGACTGSSATCQGTNGWVCNYGIDVELKSCTSSADCTAVTCNSSGECPGELAFEESRCDNKDNDCDGSIDEVFTTKGATCYEPLKYGICQGTGANVCNPAGTAVECSITSPGQAAIDELCNGKDDDCDGTVDEESDDAAGKGVVDSMVRIQRTYSGTPYDFYIYTYEASRPDADGTSGGTSSSRACSTTAVMPWSNLTYAQAAAACVAAGKRLCTSTEWYLGCAGASYTVFPYAATYDGTRCNGKDYSTTSDAVIATGTAANTSGSCRGTDGAWDMSGNLKEWTNDPQSSGGSVVGYTVRGGAYDNIFLGLTCTNEFVVMPPLYYFPNLGFRCCSDTAP